MSNCELHKFHRPQPVYLELHHIIPQAWQRSVNSGKLFDPRTASICRTGHGNVHYWLVLMNHRHANFNYTEIQPLKWCLQGQKYNTAEGEMAWQALERWVAAGYLLTYLWDHRLWGEI